MKYEYSVPIGLAETEFISKLPFLSSSSTVDMTRMWLPATTDTDSIRTGAQTDPSCHVTMPFVSSWPDCYIGPRVSPPPSQKRRGIRRVCKRHVCCTSSEGRILFIMTQQRTAVMTVVKTSVLRCSWPYSRYDLLHCGYVNIFRSVLHLRGDVPLS
jgi:hypothetical protein